MPSSTSLAQPKSPQILVSKSFCASSKKRLLYFVVERSVICGTNLCGDGLGYGYMWRKRILARKPPSWFKGNNYPVNDLIKVDTRVLPTWKTAAYASEVGNIRCRSGTSRNAAAPNWQVIYCQYSRGATEQRWPKGQKIIRNFSSVINRQETLPLLSSFWVLLVSRAGC